jgi:hypothetical protein
MLSPLEEAPKAPNPGTVQTERLHANAVLRLRSLDLPSLRLGHLNRPYTPKHAESMKILPLRTFQEEYAHQMRRGTRDAEAMADSLLAVYRWTPEVRDCVHPSQIDFFRQLKHDRKDSKVDSKVLQCTSMKSGGVCLATCQGGGINDKLRMGYNADGTSFYVLYSRHTCKSELQHTPANCMQTACKLQNSIHSKHFWPHPARMRSLQQIYGP